MFTLRMYAVGMIVIVALVAALIPPPPDDERDPDQVAQDVALVNRLRETEDSASLLGGGLMSAHLQMVPTTTP